MVEGTLVSHIEISEYASADYDAVYRVWERSGLFLRPSDERSAVDLKVTRDPDLFLVARIGRDLVGTAMGGWDGRRAYIYHLSVDPPWQRHAIATLLMDELERRFIAKGALKAKLQILPGNKISWAFFRQRGYLVEEGLVPVGKELVPGGAPPDWVTPADASLE